MKTIYTPYISHPQVSKNYEFLTELSSQQPEPSYSEWYEPKKVSYVNKRMKVK